MVDMSDVKNNLGKWNDDRKIKAAEKRINLTITIGKKELSLKLNSNVVMRQRSDGLVYFEKRETDLYEILSYDWNGPKYSKVIETVSHGKDNSKSKRTGRATGAIVGSILAPGVGTIIGAMIGTGNKKKKGTTDTQSFASEYEEEIEAPALLKLKNKNTNEIITIGFNCDTDRNLEMKKFIPNKIVEKNNVSALSDVEAIERIKRFKSLMDEGIITQEEFDQKKKELLGI